MRGKRYCKREDKREKRDDGEKQRQSRGQDGDRDEGGKKRAER
jgi:hypothetical protein